MTYSTPPCPHCVAGAQLYWWQGYWTHQLRKKLPGGGISFSHITCQADKYWKEKKVKDAGAENSKGDDKPIGKV